MNLHNSYTRYLLGRRTSKRIIIFVLVTIVHNFIIFPSHAVATSGFVSTKNIEVIKSPTSTAKRFERLVAAEPTFDDRSELAKNFSVIPDAPIKPVTAPKNRLFTGNSGARFNIKTADIPSNEIKTSHFVTLTAYNSEAGQTDGDPCTTANGFNLCKHGQEDSVAANFLPFGTKLKMPTLFGDRIFVVRDRTAPKYRGRVDVWFKGHRAAMQFGKRHAQIVVVK